MKMAHVIYISKTITEKFEDYEQLREYWKDMVRIQFLIKFDNIEFSKNKLNLNLSLIAIDGDDGFLTRNFANR